MTRARQRLARVVTGEHPTPPQKGDAGRRALQQVGALRNRVDRLEAELRESRQLNRRLAEVTDVLAELLLAAEQRDEKRDEERLRRLLEAYDRGI